MFDPTTGELFLFFYATNPNDQKKCIIDIGPIFTSYGKNYLLFSQTLVQIHFLIHQNQEIVLMEQH